MFLRLSRIRTGNPAIAAALCACALWLRLGGVQPALASADNPPPEAAGLDAYRRGAYAEAAAAWQRCAAQHDAACAMFLGVMYDAGRGVARDPQLALSWYRKAAAEGSAAAMFNIAVLYDAGAGIGADPAQAVHWYSLAAQAGIGRASYALGLIFQNGDGVPRDRALAAHYFALAARQGIVAARSHLAGRGARDNATTAPFTPSTLPLPAAEPMPLKPARVPALTAVPRTSSPDAPEPPADLPPVAELQRLVVPDDGQRDFRAAEQDLLSPRPEQRRQALAHLSAAARKRLPVAEYDLGYCYDTGLDTPHDPPRAYAWYLRALVDADSPDLRRMIQTGAERLRPTISDADAQRALNGELTR